MKVNTERSILVKPNGSEVEVTPKNGTDFSLEEMNKFVEGPIEIVYLKDMLCVVNEEGKIKGKEFNATATVYAMAMGLRDDVLVGNVLFCPIDKIR